ncbi:tetraacyldisaccharide 4'-kinase [Polyangium aurulentum]|uniref:tetraacyldisaccharide 4'-kinase n=1 Tax=Polyangium aurulentum TaxID=2567896 RepID=UPI0010AEA32B|nr:tetraacyldisaccharide 4'-kinase [Polyangium aurulentum]UQA62585.1 tetraacyldisaccharide 4'-kinase [Polyangium aurulentum]
MLEPSDELLSVRARIARRLERGAPPSLLGRALEAAWAAVASPRLARPLSIPEGARVIGVGSAVLGGAGKTPVAIALAAGLAERGHAVALIGHAYRARPERARAVSPDDPVTLVGDDALSCARKLAPHSVPVLVAPSRAEALAYATREGRDVLVVDGLLQAAPARITDAILLLDAAAPWGAGRCPPLGDLRAPPEALLAASDHVAALVGAGALARSAELPAGAVTLAASTTSAVDPDGRAHDLSSLARLRVGLAVAIARPGRLLATLAVHGIHPAAVLALADHAAFGPSVERRARRAAVDAWLTTARCATKLPPRFGGAPVLALEHSVDVGPLLPRLSAIRGA